MGVLWLIWQSGRSAIAHIAIAEFRMSELTALPLKSQVKNPHSVRERLGLQAGDEIAWSLLSNGSVVARPKTRRLVDLVGMLTRPAQPGVGVDEMRPPG
jgi:antitoxin PrlF